MYINAGQVKEAFTQAKKTKWYSRSNRGGDVIRLQVKDAHELHIIATDGEYRHTAINVPLLGHDGSLMDVSLEYKPFDKIMGMILKSDYDTEVELTVSSDEVEYETYEYIDGVRTPKTNTRIDRTVTISVGGANYTLPAVDNVDDNDLFAQEQEEEVSHQMIIEVGDLRNALDQVLPSAGTDETRPILCSAYMVREVDDICRFVTTDTYQLAYSDAPASSTYDRPEKGIVVSRYTLEALMAVTQSTGGLVTITQRGENFVEFAIGNVTLIGHTIEGQYIHYKKVIGHNVHEESGEALFTFSFVDNPTSVVKQIAKVGKLVDDKNRILLDFVEGSSKVTIVGRGAFGGAKQSKRMSMTCEIDITEPATHTATLAYDWQRFSDIIKRTGAYATFETTVKDGISKVNIDCHHDESCHVLMPMQVER